MSRLRKPSIPLATCVHNTITRRHREGEEFELSQAPGEDVIWYVDPEPFDSAFDLLDDAIKENYFYMYQEKRRNKSHLVPEDNTKSGETDRRPRGEEGHGFENPEKGETNLKINSKEQVPKESPQTAPETPPPSVKAPKPPSRSVEAPEPPPPFHDPTEKQVNSQKDQGNLTEAATLTCHRSSTNIKDSVGQKTDIPGSHNDSSEEEYTTLPVKATTATGRVGTEQMTEKRGSILVDCSTQVNQEPIATTSSSDNVDYGSRKRTSVRNVSISGEYGMPTRTFGYPLPLTPEIARRQTTHEILDSYPPVGISDPTFEQGRVLDPQFDYRVRKEIVRLPSRRVSSARAIVSSGCCAGCGQCTGVKCMKSTVIALNVIFLLFGLAIVGVGIWVLVDPRPSSYLQVGGVDRNQGNQGSQGEPGRFGSVLTYLMLATGGAMFLISLFGLFGAAFKNRCLLVSYVVFVSVLLVSQIGVVILAFMHQTWLGTTFHTAMMSFLAGEYDGGVTLVSKAWDTMQVNLRCCGVDGRGDWVSENSVWYNITGAREGWSWPKSCCPLTGNDPDDDLVDPERCRQGVTAYTATCYTELTQWFRSWGAAIGGVVIIVLALQLVIVILAGLLQQDVKEKGQAVAPYP